MKPNPLQLVTFTALAAVLIVPTVQGHEDAEHAAFEVHDIDVTFRINGFGMAELNFEAMEGTSIDWSVATDANVPPYVDVHTHGANATTVRYFTETNASRIQETFVVPDDGVYSIYIKSESGRAAEYTLTAAGTFAIVSTEGFEITEDSPAVPIAIALGGLAVLLIAVAFVRRA